MKATEGIRTFVEHKVDGVWQRVANEIAPPDPPLEASWNLYRNFELFGLLAGVDVKHFEAYIQPRSLPNDVSEEVKTAWNEGQNACVPSYWTLSELIECGAKSQAFTALVDMGEYRAFKKNGHPNSWNSAYGSYKIVSNQVMERVMKMANLVEGTYCTEVAFEYPYKLVSKRLWDDLIPAMQKLDEDVNNVRMVFWFER